MRTPTLSLKRSIALERPGNNKYLVDQHGISTIKNVKKEGIDVDLIRHFLFDKKP